MAGTSLGDNTQAGPLSKASWGKGPVRGEPPVKGDEGGAGAPRPSPILCKGAKCPSPPGAGTGLWALGQPQNLPKCRDGAAPLWPRCLAGRWVACVPLPMMGGSPCTGLGPATTGRFGPGGRVPFAQSSPRCRPAALPPLPQDWARRGPAGPPGQEPPPAPGAQWEGARSPLGRQASSPASPRLAQESRRRCGQRPAPEALPRGVVWGSPSPARPSRQPRAG